MIAFESVIGILWLIRAVSGEERLLANVSCDINPAPAMILFCVLLIWLLIYLLCLLLDGSQKKMFEAVASSDPNEPKMVAPPHTSSARREPVRENVNPGPVLGGSSSSDDKKGQSDYTENFYIAQEAPRSVKKTRLGEIFEGHLTLGLYLYRSDYPRILRVFTIITIWLFELLMLGVLFRNLEDTAEGNDLMDSHDIADNYTADYFAYAIYTLLICIPIAIYLIVILSKPNCHVFWFLSAIFVGIAIIIGSIVGVVFSTYDICHEWGGYWAISYVICISMEIFLFETIFMFIRWRTIEYYRNKQEA